MKLVSWNCKGGFIRKFAAIASLNPDVLVVPEAGDIRDFQGTLDGPAISTVSWVGANKTKGLAVLTFGSARASVHETYDPKIQWVLPLKINGELSLNLLAVWTIPHAVSRLYVNPLFEALERYEDLVRAGRCVIAGDFNANVKLDRERDKLKFSDWVDKAASLGLTSAYHAGRGLSHGLEEDPTFFLQHNLSKPYHIDFIFASDDMFVSGSRVEVGKPDEWGSMSDHMPLNWTIQ